MNTRLKRDDWNRAPRNITQYIDDEIEQEIKARKAQLEKADREKSKQLKTIKTEKE